MKTIRPIAAAAGLDREATASTMTAHPTRDVRSSSRLVCLAVVLSGCATGAGHAGQAACGPTSDARPPADAATAVPIDGGWDWPDAAWTPPDDAAAVTDEDAAVVVEDAGVPGDADSVPVDAAVVRSDAGSGSVDAGAGADAATPRPDAGGADAGTCDELTDTNVAHVAAGRALICPVIHACALGSGDDLGAYATTVTTTLRRTGAFRYELGPCP